MNENRGVRTRELGDWEENERCMGSHMKETNIETDLGSEKELP